MQELDKLSSSKKRRTTPKKQLKPPNANDIVELLSKKYGGINIFFATMLIVSFFILLTGISIAKNVAQYRTDYSQLQAMKKDHELLKVEHRKLLIEQQTFSAIPKVASRAASELEMYHPTMEDKIILKAPTLEMVNEEKSP